MMDWLYRLADAARDRGRRKFWPPEQASGRRAEDLAHRFLRRRGMVIVARNYRPPSGAGDGQPLLYKEGENCANQADARFVVRSITSAMTLHGGHATQTAVAVERVGPATALRLRALPCSPPPGVTVGQA